MEDEHVETNRLRRVLEDSPDPQAFYIDLWLLFAMFGLTLELLSYFKRWCSVRIDVWMDAFHCGFLLFFRGPTSMRHLVMFMLQSRIEELHARRLLVAVIARDLQGSIRTSRGFI